VTPLFFMRRHSVHPILGLGPPRAPQAAVDCKHRTKSSDFKYVICDTLPRNDLSRQGHSFGGFSLEGFSLEGFMSPLSLKVYLPMVLPIGILVICTKGTGTRILSSIDI